ncbi:MAG: formylglycine-generating enzyme family protein [Bacteroidales bacterium]|nr:formylglycine-generating enzyme family protein [Bacteroidales bacterium]
MITLNTGDEIEALVQKIGEAEVAYKRWDFQDGPTFTIKKSELFRIVYQNGTKEVFTDSKGRVEQQVNMPTNYISADVPRQFRQPRHPAESDMIFVKGDTFWMGCTTEQVTDCDTREYPAHKVTLGDFYIGKYEVTQAQWVSVMGSNPSYFKRNIDCPVERVSWFDIVGTEGDSVEINGITYYEDGFIYKLNQLTGKQYRLPTEAEWEYAARGGNRSRGYKYSGSNNIREVTHNGDRPRVGGTRQANELGIYDMSGNVWEWCSDWYSGTYYSDSPQDNPTGPSSGLFRVVRGGSWENISIRGRVSNRSHCRPNIYYESIGFRLVLDP